MEFKQSETKLLPDAVTVKHSCDKVFFSVNETAFAQDSGSMSYGSLRSAQTVWGVFTIGPPPWGRRLKM